MRTLLPVLLAVLCFLPIEVLLLARVWAQVTSQPTDTQEMERLFSLTDSLAAPFQPLAGGPPLRTTGVVDFTVLVAIEGYFIAMLVAVCAIVMAGWGWAFISRHRTRELPEFVRRLKAPKVRRRAWQPVAATRRPGRYYLTVSLRDDGPAHAKAGLGPL